MNINEIEFFKTFLNSNEYKDFHSECCEERVSMLPNGRKEVFPQNISNFKVSGVAVILTLKENVINIVFIKRAEDNSVHNGQIAFPGGKIDLDLGDKNTFDATIRETDEEIGLKVSEKNLLKQLNTVYIPPSNFIVDPYLFFIDKSVNYLINEDEVAEIYEIPVYHLLNQNNIATEKFKTKYGLIEAPCYIWHDIKIWGATAMILAEFLSLYKKFKELC